MASLHTRVLSDGSTVYRVVLRPDGRQKVLTLGDAVGADEIMTLARRLGDKAALAIREARVASDRAGSNMPTLAERLEYHLKQLASYRTPGTVAEYRRMASRTWLPTLGPLPIDAITRDTVIAWIGEQRNTETARSVTARTKALAAAVNDPTVLVPDRKRYSAKSIANAHGLLSAVLDSAHADELIPRNVAKSVPLPNDDEHAEMVILTAAEFARIYTAIPPAWRTLVALLYATGLRWGEATALRPSDLDLEAVPPVLRVTRAWKKGETGVYLGSPKTRRGKRTIALPAQLLPALRALADATPLSSLLFTSTEGMRVSAQHFHGRVWTPALVAARIGKHPRVHDLRHTYASEMIAAGMDLLQLQYSLGHESLKTTGDTYGHLRSDVYVSGAALATANMARALPTLA